MFYGVCLAISSVWCNFHVILVRTTICILEAVDNTAIIVITVTAAAANLGTPRFTHSRATELIIARANHGVDGSPRLELWRL